MRTAGGELRVGQGITAVDVGVDVNVVDVGVDVDVVCCLIHVCV